MGYNYNLSTVERAKGFLETLKKTPDNMVSWRSPNPVQLQYIIHNALAAAEMLEVTEFKDLRAVWKVRAVVIKQLVIAERKRGKLVTPEAEIMVDDAADVYGIVTHLAKHKDTTAHPIIYNGVNMSDPEDRERLKKYCDNYDLIFKIEGDTVRVTRT